METSLPRHCGSFSNLVAYGLAGAVDVVFLLPFAAGNVIYIATADLIPAFTTEESAHGKVAHTAAFAVGLGLLYLLAVLVS